MNLYHVTKSAKIASSSTIPDRFSLPMKKGRFGPYGGSYVPETLYHPLKELNDAYLEAKSDPNFLDELNKLLGAICGTQLNFTLQNA